MSPLIKLPPALQKGDQIGIFIPSSPVKEPFRSQGLQKITDLGYQPREIEHVFSRHRHYDFLANSPQTILADIQTFLADPGIRALWAGRGGYGSNHLLPLLNQLQINEPKIIIGSSDVSYLLWYLLDHFHLVVFYGPMVYSSLAEDRFDRPHLESILSGHFHDVDLSCGTILVPGSAQGITTGGCLSNLVSLVGTPYFPILEERILLLEDVGERPYRLDRLLWQLDQAKVFSHIRGLLLGEFPRCFNTPEEKTAFLYSIEEYTRPYSIPVIYDLPFGHGHHIRTFPLGIEIHIQV